MLELDKKFGLCYTPFILDKEMCIDNHITNPFCHGSYNTWRISRSVVQYVSSNHTEGQKGT